MLFDADPDHIALLDSTSLVKLLKRLVLAESRLVGIPLRAASVPLQITIPDGGDDGRVEWSGGEGATAYLPDRLSVFQSKAQKLTKARVKAEVLKRSRKGPPKLSPVIVEVLAKGGAYIIFCREPMVTTKRKVLAGAIRAAIRDGGGNPNRAAAIEVYDANLIADWVDTHPSVALWLASQRLGRNLAGFQTHEGWGRTPEFSSPRQLSDEPRFVPINSLVPTDQRKDANRNSWTEEQAAQQIRRFLASEKAIVRLFGPSGYGKSRFIFELLNSRTVTADEIDNASVIYCDGSIAGDEAAKLSLELADAGLAAIFVVDECADALHLKLSNLIGRSGSRLRLVTLDIESQVLQAKDTNSIRIERADEKFIKDVAAGVAPHLSDRDKSFIAELAEGFPSMAVLAAQQEAAAAHTFMSAEQLLDRVIWSGKRRDTQAQKALEVASLFEWMGIQGRVESQAAFAATELAQMPLAVFVEHLLAFKPRGIVIQRGDFVQVGPVPLAARLGIRRLSVMTTDKLLQVFQTAPDELQFSLLNRLKWLDTSPTAVAFAERLLQSDVLGNLAFLSTEAGAKLLDRLVHVAPGVASTTIDRVFSELKTDELKSLRDGRRYLVFALEKLVFRKETFERSARTLLKLSVAENERYGNNASGIFKQLFQLYLGGTEADAAARFRVLDEAFVSHISGVRAICIDALGQMLDTRHFSRTGGAEQIGSSIALEDWHPSTYEEARFYLRGAMSRLLAVALDDQGQAQVAKTHLASHIRGLLSTLPTEEVKTMIGSIIARHGFWPEAIGSVSDWLYFDRGEKVPPEVACEIRLMYDELLPTDLVYLAVLYTYGWPADLHDPDAIYEREKTTTHDFEFASRQAIAVAGKIANSARLIKACVEQLACSNHHGVYPFAVELMRRVRNPKALFNGALKFAEDSSNAPNRSFFSALIASANERDPQLAKTFIRSALASPALKSEAISLIGAGSLQADDIALLVLLIKSGDVPPSECRHLGLSRVSIDLLMSVLRELERHGNDGLWSIVDIVSFYLHGGKVTANKQLISLVKRVLVAPSLMDATRTNMDGYHLEQMVERLAKLGMLDEPYVRKLSKQVMRICRQGKDRVYYDLDDPVRKILGHLVAVHPQAAWPEVAKKLTGKSWHGRFYAEHLLVAHHRDDHLARGISFEMAASVYLDWVREKPSVRAHCAVAWLPIATKEESGQLLWHPELEDFITEFGEQPHVLSSLHQRLTPTTYWGGLAPYLAPIVPLIQRWSAHQNLHVRQWAAGQLEWLDKTIRAETKRSEESVVRFG